MNWDTPLAEPIALTGRRQRFRTLREAAEFLSERYGNARGGVLEGALRDLMAAAERPAEDTVGRATRQFARFLADENLIEELPPLRDYSEGLERRIRDMLAGRSSAARAKLAQGLTKRRGPTRR